MTTRSIFAGTDFEGPAASSSAGRGGPDAGGVSTAGTLGGRFVSDADADNEADHRTIQNTFRNRLYVFTSIFLAGLER
jgi:hypothetical protein